MDNAYDVPCALSGTRNAVFARDLDFSRPYMHKMHNVNTDLFFERVNRMMKYSLMELCRVYVDALNGKRISGIFL